MCTVNKEQGINANPKNNIPMFENIGERSLSFFSGIIWCLLYHNFQPNETTLNIYCVF